MKQEDNQQTQSSNTPAEFELSKTLRLLIAEDEEDSRALLEIIFAPDFELTLCANGSEALTHCQQELPDLAILDIQMPGMLGTELCKWIKARCGSVFVPVVMLTAQSEVEQRVYGLDCGADDYITKPFAVTELEARVRSLLRVKTLTDQLRATKELLAEKERELLVMQLAGGAAHELGQPLTSLLLHCQLLSKLAPPGAEFSRSITGVNEQCMRIKEIVDKLGSLREISVESYPGELSILNLSDPKER